MSFNEITLSDGECEVMVHISTGGGRVIALYAYAEDVKNYCFPESWQWKAGQNPLFLHLDSPLPATAKRALHARGFRTSEEDDSD
jgi:hypothetical protein